MKRFSVFVLSIVVPCLIVGCFTGLHQKLKAAYWVVRFLNEYSDVSTNDPRKDGRYALVLADNGNYVLSQRGSPFGHFVSWIIEVQDERLKSARIKYEERKKVLQASGDDLSLEERLKRGIGGGVKIEMSIDK